MHIVGSSEGVQRGAAAHTAPRKRTPGRFLEACLLQLLSEGTGHGDLLMERLGQLGFAGRALNISTLYRTLRGLEREGCVRSEWERGGAGPNRRNYRILEKGAGVLRERVGLMKTRMEQIKRLISRYEAPAAGACRGADPAEAQSRPKDSTKRKKEEALNISSI